MPDISTVIRKVGRRDRVKLIEGSALTADGVQYSDEVTTVTVNTYYDALLVDVDPSQYPAQIMELIMALTAEFKRGAGVNVNIMYDWQVRQRGGSWGTLTSPTSLSGLTDAWTSAARQGIAPLFAGAFDTVPFELKLQFKCTTAGQTAKARVKSSSYLEVFYRA